MSKIIKTNIIPDQQAFAKVNAKHELHLEAICVFAAIGFFLDQDTYWKDQMVLPPASVNTLNDALVFKSSKPWFEWHYTPRELTFEHALNEFSELFETIINEQVKDKKVILPLSGGLDSRTQAVALKAINADVMSYSYQFHNGYNETEIAQQIANASGFKFEAFHIKEGYLWKDLETLYELNKGYSDFTAPRQMAIYQNYSKMGDVFSLGHWGDVLFDSMNLPQLTQSEEIEVLQKKLLKKGGLELATQLWKSWGLPGNFESYFKMRIEKLLDTIQIDDTNAKLRAFKSKYWAPRWTSINLSVFRSVAPVELPYYDNRMCEFICTIPEAYLKNRQLQIAYIRSRSPELAKIMWQDHRPFNLNTYQYNRFPYHIPYKIFNKIKRELQGALGKAYVQRNWELQFLGDVNQKQLQYHLLETGLKKMDTRRPYF